MFAKADNDEIRGVDTICFGDCTPTGCQETSVVTHDTTWFEPECVDGGVIRPKATYTNQEYSIWILVTDLWPSGRVYGFDDAAVDECRIDILNEPEPQDADLRRGCCIHP